MHPEIITEIKPAEKSKNWLSKLQSQGYRLTSSRKTIVEILAFAEQSLSAAELYKGLPSF